MFWTCAHFQIQRKITGPKTRTTDKTFGITVEAFEDKVNLDKAIQCPEDLWECPTQAILVGVVKDTARETHNSRARGRGYYSSTGWSSSTFRQQSSISTDRWTSDRDIYHQRQNKRTWGKNCNIIYTMLHKIDL